MVGGKLTSRRIIVGIVRLALAAVFIYAGWLKARDPGQFIRDIWNYQLMPESYAFWLAAFVPYLEIVVGVCLIVGPRRRGAHAWIALMLVVFTGIILSAWARGLDINCGCFGRATGEFGANYPLLLARNLLLFGALAVSILMPLRTRISQGADTK